MSTNYFPSDVSLRVSGKDIGAAQALYPDAKQLLFKALAVQRNGNKHAVNLFQEGPDGSLVSVHLRGTLKTVYVAPAAPPVTKEPEEEFPTWPVPTPLLLYPMYSGLAHDFPDAGPPRTLILPDPDDPPNSSSALLQLHPDEVTSQAYGLDLEWQNVHKLGVDEDGTADTGTSNASFPKPGMYSGSMKRVVQAIMGIGKHETDTVGYISGQLPETYPDAIAFNSYSPRWNKTHGIHKAPDGGVWLIEISQENGVLAMPLPIFNKTETPEYLAMLLGFGDFDSVSVVLEFGGMPSGENFPSGPTLEQAITDGYVLRLLTATDIEEFYHDTTYDQDKQGAWFYQGWAFSESGLVADNLCFWYRVPECALALPSEWATDPYGQFAADDISYMAVAHYRITFDINSRENTGSATMEVIEETLMTGQYDINGHTGGSPPEYFTDTVFRVPTYNDVGLSPELVGFRPWGRGYRIPPMPVLVCPAHLFYDGERLEVVRYSGLVRGSFFGDSITYGTPVPSNYGALVCLLIPALCREGYVLMVGSIDVVGFGLMGLYQKGYFSQIGELEFPDMANPITSDLIFDLYDMMAWPMITNYPSFNASSIAYDFPMSFAMNINASPTLSYVAHKGIFLGRDQYTPLGLARETETEIPQVGMEIYDYPADTSPNVCTFVGSPS